MSPAPSAFHFVFVISSDLYTPYIYIYVCVRTYSSFMFRLICNQRVRLYIYWTNSFQCLFFFTYYHLDQIVICIWSSSFGFNLSLLLSPSFDLFFFLFLLFLAEMCCWKIVHLLLTFWFLFCWVLTFGNIIFFFLLLGTWRCDYSLPIGDFLPIGKWTEPCLLILIKLAKSWEDLCFKILSTNLNSIWIL